MKKLFLAAALLFCALGLFAQQKWVQTFTKLDGSTVVIGFSDIRTVRSTTYGSTISGPTSARTDVQETVATVVSASCGRLVQYSVRRGSSGDFDAVAINPSFVSSVVSGPGGVGVIKMREPALVLETASTFASVNSTLSACVAGGGGGATNLTTTRDATTVTINSDTGGDAIVPTATGTLAGVLTATDYLKLAGLSNYTAPDHTGDVTSVGDGATTIALGAVTNAKLANMAAQSIKGNTNAFSASAADLTVSQARSLLSVQSILSGAGGPSSGTGSVGDFYLNQSTGQLYEKTGASTWTLRQSFLSFRGVVADQTALNALTNVVDGQWAYVNNSNGLSGGANLHPAFVTYGSGSWSIFNYIYITAQNDPATHTTAGIAALLPTRLAGTQNKYIRGDATWASSIPAWNNGVWWEVGDVVYNPSDDKIYRTTTAHNASGGAFNAANFTELSQSNGGGMVQYSAGNGCTVVASGTGVTFTRSTASQWVVTIPAGVFLHSFRIYSTSGENPGSNVTITFDYTGNTLTNQDLGTASVPNFAAWLYSTGSTQAVVVGGSSASAWRPAIVEPVTGGDISIQAQMGSVMSSGATMISGNF